MTTVFRCPVIHPSSDLYLPPPPLYSCLSVPFATFLPLLSLLIPALVQCLSSHSYIPSYPYRLLLQWVSLLLQSLPLEVQDLPRLPLDKALLPLNANTERCSRMAPVKCGPRTLKRFSYKVRAVIAPPCTLSAVLIFTCHHPFQAFGSTGNLHGPPIRVAAADGATNSSSTT